MSDEATERPGEQRLTATGKPEPVDDPVLEEIARELPSDDGNGDDLKGILSTQAPFDLGIPEPRAIDLRHLWRLVGKEPDPQIVAALGPNIPVLLSHSVTAFPTNLRTPRVWMISYRTSIFGTPATVQDYQPQSELIDILSVGARADLEISLGGKLEVPAEVKTVLNQVPGVTINDAEVSAGLKETAKLRIKFTLSVPRIIAGEEAGAGVRWQLYAQDRRLDGHQALLQTVLVPAGTEQLRVEVISAVASRSGPLGIQQRWRFETASFAVSLEGLGQG